MASRWVQASFSQHPRVHMTAAHYSCLVRNADLPVVRGLGGDFLNFGGEDGVSCCCC